MPNIKFTDDTANKSFPVWADKILWADSSLSYDSIINMNLSDLPVSTPTQTALNAKQNTLIAWTNITIVWDTINSIWWGWWSWNAWAFADELQTATAWQTVFNLGFNFVVWGNLLVFVEWRLQTRTSAYTETDTNTITFATWLDVWSEVYFFYPNKWLNWQWTYSWVTAYVVDDAVYYNWSSYICKLDSTWNLPTNTSYWDLLVSNGWNMYKATYDPANISEQLVWLTATQSLTNKTFTDRVLTPEVKATNSAWIDLHNNTGTQIAIFGAWWWVWTSLNGTTNIGSVSADYHQINWWTWTITDTATGSSTDISINLVPKWAGKLKSNWTNVALVSDKLSAFASTSSSELAGVISDETGNWALVFASSPTLVTPTLWVASATSLAVTGTTWAWYLTLIWQSSNPSSPAAWTLLLHSSTANGFTRMEQDNEAATNLIYWRDNAFIAKNTSWSTINKWQVVYVNWSTWNVPNIALAKADSSTTIPTIAIVIDNITNNSFWQIMYAGIISWIDTSSFTSWDKLYVSPTVAWWLTNVRPSWTTNYVQRVWTVLNSWVWNGSIQVLIAPAVLNSETGTNAATWTWSAIVWTSYNWVWLTNWWSWALTVTWTTSISWTNTWDQTISPWTAVTATAWQTVFTTPTYVIWNNKLMVYVNWHLQEITTHYTETSTTSITFVTWLDAWSIVSYRLLS